MRLFLKHRVCVWLLVGVWMPALHAIQFEDVNTAAGISASHDAMQPSCGQAVADVDGNGWLDFFTTGDGDPNALYLNQGDGTFAAAPFEDQVATSNCGPAAFADYDNDGWADLYVGCQRGEDNHLFRNTGGNGFQDVTAAAGVNHTNRSEAVTWADFNEDGWLDLFVGTYPQSSHADRSDPQNWDQLFISNGDGTFTSISDGLDPAQLVKTALAATFADLDNDGDLDLYVVNDKEDGNTLWRNDGPGCGGWCFTDVSVATGADRPVFGMGIAADDPDLDGDLDLYFSSIAEQVYLRNDLTETGSLSFTESSTAVNLDYDTIGWATHFLDADNDRRLDAYLASSRTTPAPVPDRFYRNIGGLNAPDFDDISATSGDVSDGAPTMGASQWDYDGDGRQDLLACNWNQGYRLLRNITGNAGHWLALALSGTQGHGINRDAIGTRVTVTTPDGQSQIREVASGQARGGNSSLVAHFGLGSYTSAEVLIEWPDGHLRQWIPPYVDDRFQLSAEEVMRSGFEQSGAQ